MIFSNVGFNAVFKRELASYFQTPLGYVFIAIFLLLSGFFTFELGNFFNRSQADLSAFFNFHPWLFLILVPPIAMRLWSEERKSGSIELLMTLPISVFQAVLGKFFAAWVFLGVALFLTMPIWLTVNYLGEPDNGAILAAYLGSWLMSGAFLAVGSCMSALTRSQVVALILTVSLCFVFCIIGFPMLQKSFHGWAPSWLLDTLVNLSFFSHFQAISRGVIDLRDLLFFLAFIALWLVATTQVINGKKAD